MFALLLLLMPLFCLAADDVVSSCAITPEIYLKYDIPEKSSRSNNLLERSDSVYRAVGRPIIIEGRVLDARCVPITNAIVRIWQLNRGGFDQRDDMGRNQEENIERLRYHDANFSSSGTASTNSLGYYRFMTIMPGAVAERMPHINFAVDHPSFVRFTTAMFFKDVSKNGSKFTYKDDPDLKKYPSILTDLLTANFVSESDGIRRYRFDITLAGADNYKRY